MVALAVIVAIIDDGRVLLTKREDFEVWCLPGGGVSVRQEIKISDTKTYTRKEIYETCDRSGLTRQQFYLQRLEDAEMKEIVEVGSS